MTNQHTQYTSKARTWGPSINRTQHTQPKVGDPVCIDAVCSNPTSYLGDMQQRAKQLINLHAKKLNQAQGQMDSVTRPPSTTPLPGWQHLHNLNTPSYSIMNAAEQPTTSISDAYTVNQTQINPLQVESTFPIEPMKSGMVHGVKALEGASGNNVKDNKLKVENMLSLILNHLDKRYVPILQCPRNMLNGVHIRVWSLMH